MSTNKQIRDEIAGLITPALSTYDANIQVFTFKKAVPGADNYNPIVCVYMEQGGVENSVSFAEDQAELTVYILHPDQADVDDALDAIADVIKPELASTTTVTNSLHTAWQYLRDEHPGWTALTLTYQLFN